MPLANPGPEPSSPVDPDKVLVSTTFRHPKDRCGIRVPSPHDACQSVLEPYNAAEQFVSRWGDAIILCRCGEAWREIAA